MTFYKTITLSLLFVLVPAYAQEASNVGGKKNQVILNPDGSKTIITFGVNERGKNIKTVTIIKITEFLDGSKLISKSVKIFGLDNKEEVLEESYVQNSIIRPNYRNYRNIKTNDVVSKPVSPDGR